MEETHGRKRRGRDRTNVKRKKRRSIFHSSFFTSRNPIRSAKEEMISVPSNTTKAGHISLMIPGTLVFLIKLIITSVRGESPAQAQKAGFVVNALPSPA
jgi:hypothetical protein